MRPVSECSQGEKREGDGRAWSLCSLFPSPWFMPRTPHLFQLSRCPGAGPALKTRAVTLSWEGFCPQGTSDNAWTHFWLSQGGGVHYWCLVGRGQRGREASSRVRDSLRSKVFSCPPQC